MTSSKPVSCGPEQQMKCMVFLLKCPQMKAFPFSFHRDYKIKTASGRVQGGGGVLLFPNATLFLSPQSLIHNWGPSRLRRAWRTPSSGDGWPKQMQKMQLLLPLSGMANQKMGRTEGALWLDLFWWVKFWADSGQAEPRSPRFPTGSTRRGLFDFFAVAAAVAAAAAVAGGL